MMAKPNPNPDSPRYCNSLMEKIGGAFHVSKFWVNATTVHEALIAKVECNTLLTLLCFPSSANAAKERSVVLVLFSKVYVTHTQ